MVGRNLREHPLAKSHEVIAPARREVDLMDLTQVRAAMAAAKPDVVIHTAGRVGGIIANMNNQSDFLIENFEMGKNLVVAARDIGVKLFINLGSSCIYPKAAPNPLREEYMLSGAFEPTNEGYALAKVAVLKLVQFAAEVGGLQYKTLIPPNLFGRYDNFDPVNSHFPAGVIRKIHEAKLANKTSVDIWGDGTVRRELMAASDLAAAIWFVLDHMAQLPPMINVGVNHDISILDYYQAAATVIGWRGDWQFLTDKPIGMKQKIMDSSFLHGLGFRPALSLTDGIKNAYDYFLTLLK